MANRVRFVTVTSFLGLAFLVIAGNGCKKASSGGDAPTDNAPAAATTAPQTQTKPMVGAAGSACGGNGWYGCSPDGVHEVMCVNGVWQQWRTCRGPNHCRHNGNVTNCDFGVLLPGDACGSNTHATCTGDSKGILSCQGGRMTVTQTCTGTQKCIGAVCK